MIRGLLFTSLGYFETTPSARINHRLANDLIVIDQVLPTNYAFFIMFMANAGAGIVATMLICFKISQYAFLLVFCMYLVVLVVVFTKLFVRHKQLHDIEQDKKVNMQSQFNEILNGVTTIRAYQKS